MEMSCGKFLDSGPCFTASLQPASLQPAGRPAVMLRAHESSPDDTGSQGTKRGHMTAPGHTSLQGQGRQIPFLSFCVLALRTALLGLFPPKEFLHLPHPKKHSLISTRAVVGVEKDLRAGQPTPSLHRFHSSRGQETF